MNRLTFRAPRYAECVPRTRGDEPVPRSVVTAYQGRSPHTRG